MGCYKGERAFAWGGGHVSVVLVGGCGWERGEGGSLAGWVCGWLARWVDIGSLGAGGGFEII
jgi:hypothetical protein